VWWWWGGRGRSLTWHCCASKCDAVSPSPPAPSLLADRWLFFCPWIGLVVPIPGPSSPVPCHQPENVLLSDPSEAATIKIADFGLATALESSVGAAASTLVTRCGTPAYTAPEVLMHQRCVAREGEGRGGEGGGRVTLHPTPQPPPSVMRALCFVCAWLLGVLPGPWLSRLHPGTLPADPPALPSSLCACARELSPHCSWRSGVRPPPPASTVCVVHLVPVCGWWCFVLFVFVVWQVWCPGGRVVHGCHLVHPAVWVPALQPPQPRRPDHRHQGRPVLLRRGLGPSVGRSQGPHLENPGALAGALSPPPPLLIEPQVHRPAGSQ
jgi:hypothetical protein